jgi:hypothetical protein
MFYHEYPPPAELDEGVAFKDELAELGWGKFASFLDEDGNEFGLRGY